MPRPSDPARSSGGAGSPAPTREAIGIARVLCILGMVWVHAWTGADGNEIVAASSTPQGMLRWTLIELVGRSSVPLLGAISGWLVAASAERRGYPGFVLTKARTVFAPMVAWNAIAMPLVCAFAIWGTLRAPVPVSVWQGLDWLFCATQPNPINVQISFLRDLFVCMLAAPLLARLPTGWLWAVAAGAFAWAVSGLSIYVLLRPQILLFFALGMIARRIGLADRVARWPGLPVAAVWLLVTIPKLMLSIDDQGWLKAHPIGANAVDIVPRVAAAAAMWKLATTLAVRPIGARIQQFERYAFLLFCSHLIVTWLIGPAVGMVTGNIGHRLYPLWLIAQPFFSLGVAIVVGRALERVAPPAARLLSGGRLTGARDLPAAPASAMERASSGAAS